MRVLITLFLITICLLSDAQINWDKTTYNFGSIEKDSKRWVDFELTNKTNVHIYLMRAQKDDDVDLIYSRGKIEKDSVAYVRVQINPENIGPFNKKIDLYVSSEMEPIELRIKGSINYIDPNNDPACPTFSSQNPKTNKEFIVVIEVHDKQTKQPIKNSNINVSNPRLTIISAVSDNKGKASFNSVTGLHRVFASAEGYQPNEMNASVNYNSNFIIIYLDKIEGKQIAEIEEPNIDEAIDKYIQEELAELKKEDSIIIEEYPNIIAEQEEIIKDEEYIPFSPNELSAKEYAPNNIVFLMDVSNSMAKLEKLELLKAAVKQMVGVMRSFDKIAIITYASSVNVILPSTSGAEKDKIYAIIDSLEAGGLTAGSSGIKKAYEIAFDNFIEDANNQIVITTDGAFNVEEEGYNTKQEVLLNSFKGVKLSVVGVKTARMYVQDLKDLAKWGRGHYIYITSDEDAKDSLVNELKENSKR